MTLSAELRIATPIRSPAGHAWSFEETERRLGPIYDRVPITRVYDATALDRLGVPIWGAVTPLARDLTVHAGKGMSSQAARISAVMEAVERICAEEIDGARVRRATFGELAAEDPRAVIEPDEFGLAGDTRYRPDAVFAWVRGEDLATSSQVWVALDLVLSPAREGLSWGTDTNGLAAGNTCLEATLHACYELIERDADAQRVFLRAFAEGDERPTMRLLENDSLPAPVCEWVARLQTAGLFVGIEEITHDVGVPVFRAVISDRAFPGREDRVTIFEGLGCDLDAANALQRALTEAAQAHTGVLLGARDHFEGLEPENVSRSRFLAALTTPSQRVTFAPTAPPPTLEARLAITLQRLQAVGLSRCVMVDLTREDLGIPVVRVLIPGCCGPHAHTLGPPPLRLLRHLVR